jgi:phosphoglycerate kinase
MDICAAGFLLKNEIHYFKKALANPQRPMVAVLGGSKVSSKLAAIENILPKVDRLIIGGAMANTFLLSEGYDMGKSLVEPDLVETARGFMVQAQTMGKKIYLPKDFVVAEELKPDAETKTVPVEKIPSGYMALDIGPDSEKIFGDAIKDAKTILWNGPLGAFEVDAFSKGTSFFAKKVGASSALSIAGGGDTGAAIKKAGQTDNISYISTGGGAFLELLEGKELPGIAALKECAS